MKLKVLNPTIALCKEDESAFINARTYWALSVAFEDRTYELRIKHRAPEDEISFWLINRAEHEDIQLTTAQDLDERRSIIAENEPQLCERHKALHDAGRCGDCGEFMGDHGCVTVGCEEEGCNECQAASLNYADAYLADVARAMEPVEKTIERELRRTWDAFTLLFNPITNTF